VRSVSWLPREERRIAEIVGVEIWWPRRVSTDVDFRNFAYIFHNQRTQLDELKELC
jgi:hypothetical protein